MNTRDRYITLNGDVYNCNDRENSVRELRWTNILLPGLRATAQGRDTLNSRQTVSMGSYKLTQKVTGREELGPRQELAKLQGSSAFRAVMAEYIISWYTSRGDIVLDPFAGGNVRGVVAGYLGREYVGIDLRQEQIDCNYTTLDHLPGDLHPKWICGDGLNCRDIAAGEYDYIFSCPPYGDTEQYSDMEEDLSNMGADEFADIYRQIIINSCSMLKEDRFATMVVGNYRAKDHHLVNLVTQTQSAMEAAGLQLYNMQVMVRSTNYALCKEKFTKSRKLNTGTEYVLTFVKGDPKKAVEHANSHCIIDREGLVVVDQVDLDAIEAQLPGSTLYTQISLW